MDFLRLNPYIRSVSLYEKTPLFGECVAYDDRLIYIVSGDLVATVGGEKLGHLSVGNTLFIPRGVPYKLKGKYTRMVVITFDLMSEGDAPADIIHPVAPEEFDREKLSSLPESPFDKMIRLDDMEAERDNFIRMANIFTSAEGNYRAELSARFKLILLKIAEVSDEHSLPMRMVENLDSYIRENCHDEISNTEIGAIFGYHPFYISNVLKETKGMTLRQYIIAYRLKLSKRMLRETEKTTGEIADECGFTDASYFTKTFKAAFGETPKEYRNKFKDKFI
jgi:AraC-like DNA-binding protein